MLKIGLCDDEQAEREDLHRLVANYSRQKHLPFDIQCFHNGEDLLAAICKKQSFDILFLDIFMGPTDGMTVAKKIREFDKTCSIIFATNSRDDAIAGYGVQALQYLLKPIFAENVMSALDQAMEIRTQKKYTFLQLQNRQGSYRILFKDLIFAESNARIITIHTNGQGNLDFYERLDHLTQLCSDPRFLRCHKSYLVNLDYVHAIVTKSLFLETGEKIPISISISEAKEKFASHTASLI